MNDEQWADRTTRLWAEQMAATVHEMIDALDGLERERLLTPAEQRLAANLRTTIEQWEAANQ